MLLRQAFYTPDDTILTIGKAFDTVIASRAEAALAMAALYPRRALCVICTIHDDYSSKPELFFLNGLNDSHCVRVRRIATSGPGKQKAASVFLWRQRLLSFFR